MTTSHKSDLSDVYSHALVKELLPRVFAELHANSVFTRIINEMIPSGIAQTLPSGVTVANWGRIGKSKIRYGTPLNSEDGTYIMKRTLTTKDKVTVKMELLRDTDYVSGRGYIFTNKFHLDIRFVDERLRNLRFIKNDMMGYMSFRGGVDTYDPTTDFEAFVFKLAENFSSPKQASAIEFAFNTFRGHAKNMHDATARYA